MKDRLNRIATRSGDDGSTGLADGQRVTKSHERIQALGDVDMLNSHIGVLLAEGLSAAMREMLTRIQHELFDLGGELAMPGHSLLSEAAVEALDADLQALNARLPPLKEFILPAGTRCAALAHVCRCQARQAERIMVRLRELDPTGTTATPQRYLNRLSDLLFVTARVLNGAGDGAEHTEVYWRSERLRGA